MFTLVSTRDRYAAHQQERSLSVVCHARVASLETLTVACPWVVSACLPPFSSLRPLYTARLRFLHSPEAHISCTLSVGPPFVIIRSPHTRARALYGAIGRVYIRRGTTPQVTARPTRHDLRFCVHRVRNKRTTRKGHGTPQARVTRYVVAFP